MNVGVVTGSKRPRQESGPAASGEPAAKQARRQARETCATFPDLSTIEGQDAFFQVVGVEGIEQCFREDLKTVEQVYRQKVDEHASTRFAAAKTQSVPADGDCAFHSVIAAASNLGGSAAARIPSTPMDMRLQMVAHVEREYTTWRDVPAHDIPDEKQYLAVLPHDDHERRQMLDQLGTRGSWQHGMGDLYVAIAADTFNVQIEVITPYTGRKHSLVFGSPHHHAWRLVLRRDGAHYEPVVEPRSAVQHFQHVRPELALVQHVHHARRRDDEDQRREEPGHRGE